MKKQILLPVVILLFLFGATLIAALYGKGYRFGLQNGKPDLSQTGLLVTTSSPDGAQVFINNHLTTATNSTISLLPAEYTVRIFKEGYFPWEKKIKIQKEVVSKAEGLLFPTAPKLESITASGVKNPTLDPSKTRTAYTISSNSVRKNGIYVLDMTAKPILTLQSSSTQIVDDTLDAFSNAKLSWSPDGQRLLATLSSQTDLETTYVLDTNSFNQDPKDITTTLPSQQAIWEEDVNEKEKARLASLKPQLRKMVIENFSIAEWSPDETKILYVASTSAILPQIIKPALIGTNPTPEERSIKKDSIYVYDIKEDKNFKIEIGNYQGQLPLAWFPDSKHLIFVHDSKIDIMEYDSQNNTTVYAGPFVDNYVYPWPNGSKLLILTNLNNQNIAPNLYMVGLK